MDNKSKQELENAMIELDKSIPKGEHIVNIFKAILATFPFTGGIASLITDYIPNNKQKRLIEFTKQVAEDFQKIKDKINEGALLNESYAYIFETSFRKAAENYQKIKLEAFRAIIINSAIISDLKDSEKEYFLNLANNLTPLHITILKFLSNPEDYLIEMNIPKKNIRGSFEDFSIIIPNISIDVIKIAFNELFNLGLLKDSSGIFNVLSTTMGFDLFKNKVTDVGMRFIDFIKLPK